MKIKTLIILILAWIIPLTGSSVYGHVVESDNTVGAVMHVDPGDDPVAGEQSTLLLEFKDTKDIFNLENCKCTLTVSRGDTQVLTTPISPVSNQEKLSAAIPVVFPEKGIYMAKISGKPEEDIDFKAFEFSYEVAVNKEPVTEAAEKAPESWISRQMVYLTGGLVILVFLIFASLKQLRIGPGP